MVSRIQALLTNDNTYVQNICSAQRSTYNTILSECSSLCDGENENVENSLSWAVNELKNLNEWGRVATKATRDSSLSCKEDAVDKLFELHFPRDLLKKGCVYNPESARGMLRQAFAACIPSDEKTPRLAEKAQFRTKESIAELRKCIKLLLEHEIREVVLRERCMLWEEALK